MTCYPPPRADQEAQEWTRGTRASTSTSTRTRASVRQLAHAHACTAHRGRLRVVVVLMVNTLKSSQASMGGVDVLQAEAG